MSIVSLLISCFCCFHAPPPLFYFYSENSEKISANNQADKPIIYVLKNNRNCLSCFKDIDEKIKIFRAQHADSFHYFAISGTKMNGYYTTKENRLMKSLLPNCDSVFFDPQSSDKFLQETYSEDGFFNLLQIDKTPAIIIQNKNAFRVFQLQETYDDNWLDSLLVD